MRWILSILLLLPAAEVLLSVWLYRQFGDAFLALLCLGAVAGLILLARARDSWRSVVAATRSGDTMALRGLLMNLLAGARAFVAGMLLLFPGLLTDLAALVLLTLPGRVIGRRPVAASDVIVDAEFHEIRDETRLPPN